MSSRKLFWGMGVSHDFRCIPYKIRMVFFFAKKQPRVLGGWAPFVDVSGGSDLTRYFRSHLYRP